MVDSDKFAEIYDAYFKKCYVFTKSYVHDRHVAEDIASETLLRFYEISRHEEIKNVPAYLLTLVRNKALDYLRNKAVREKAYSNLSSVDAQELTFRISTLEECDPAVIFSEEIQRIIDDTLHSLPPQTSRIFALSRYENYSNKEIASELGISIKGVEYHITKSLSSLRKNLKDYLPMAIIFFLF